MALRTRPQHFPVHRGRARVRVRAARLRLRLTPTLRRMIRVTLPAPPPLSLPLPLTGALHSGHEADHAHEQDGRAVHRHRRPGPYG